MLPKRNTGPQPLPYGKKGWSIFVITKLHYQRAHQSVLNNKKYGALEDTAVFCGER